MLLSPFETAKVLGIRALQLSEGSLPLIEIKDEALLFNLFYVAAVELRAGKLDMQVERNGTAIHLSAFLPSPHLQCLIDANAAATRYSEAN